VAKFCECTAQLDEQGRCPTCHPLRGPGKRAKMADGRQRAELERSRIRHERIGVSWGVETGVRKR
jgi:hypothetical protein